jgi:hypothetical protein
MLLNHIQTRLLRPGLAYLTDPDPPRPTRLRDAARAYRQALDQLTQKPDSPPNQQFVPTEQTRLLQTDFVGPRKLAGQLRPDRAVVPYSRGDS